MKKLNQSENGLVFYNSDKDLYYIEYKNLNFVFDINQLKNFRRYFEELDGDYYSSLNSNSLYRRKLIIPLGHKSINMMLDLSELSELKVLLNFNYRLKGRKKAFLPKFDYNFGVN